MAEDCYSKHGYPPWYKNKTGRVTNNVITDSNLEYKDNRREEHTQQQLIESQKAMQFTQEQMEQIRKIVQDSRDDSMHRANNIVGESTVLTIERDK